MNGFASLFQAHIEDSVTAVAGLHGSILAITFVPFDHYSSQVSHSKFSLPSATVYQHVITPHLSLKKRTMHVHCFGNHGKGLHFGFSRF
jgi:hypothetical protein